MPQASATISGSIAGISIAGTVVRTASGQISHEITTTAGVAGETESMDSAGTAGTIDSLDSGHGIAGADKVAIFKDAAEADGTLTCRHNVTVDDADATSFSFDDTPAASGDALPIADNEGVVVSEFNDEIDTDFDGDDVLALLIHSTTNAAVQFQEGDGTEVATIVVKANEPFLWMKDWGVTNPITGNAIGKIKVANGSTSAGTLKIGVLYDSDV